MESIKHVRILAQELRSPDQVIVREAPRPELSPEDLELIEKRWAELTAQDPSKTPGPTIVLSGWHTFGGPLTAYFFPSNYKEGQVIGFFGATMLPETSDGFFGLQGQVDNVANVIGKGIRTPGCNMKNIEVFPRIVTEMSLEFNVGITENSIMVHGLIRVEPPVATLHSAFVTSVKLPHTHQELYGCWKDAEQRWEGQLLFVEKDDIGLKRLIRYDEKKGDTVVSCAPEKFNRQSRLQLAMISGLDLVEQWPQILIP